MNKESKVVILDAGHGSQTPGKRSPEGLLAEEGQVALHEWEYNRDVVRRIANALAKAGIQFNVLVSGKNDVPLTVRTSMVNNRVQASPKTEHLLISVHANAGGGTGYEVFTSPGETMSDKIAELFYEEAEKSLKEVKIEVVEGKNVKNKTFKFKMRHDKSDGDHDKEERFAMLIHTSCSAILTENLFMDTKKDLEFMLQDAGRQVVADYHVSAIKRWLNDDHLKEEEDEDSED